MAIAFAERVQLFKKSAVRELLKITQRPEVISFAGGLPAPELFPVEEMKDATQKVLTELGANALQYFITEGYNPLREQIAARMNRKFKTNVAAKDILIVNGSQQGIDFSGKLFLNTGDVVLCESPTYLTAINAYNAYRPKFIEVPTDDDGMIIEELEKTLKTVPNVKLIYVVPDFQNPTGRTWSVERRQKFMEVVNKYEIPVIEDNPYGELTYEGEIMPSLKSFDTKNLVVFLGTFSKTFCPGLRVGWVAAPENLFDKFLLVKQACDIHTPSLNQQAISRYIDDYDLDAHVKQLVTVYKRRKDVMLKTIKENFDKEVKYTEPAGGLFIWTQLPPGIKSERLLQQCLENKVAFVPGNDFFPTLKIENTFRLNFSNMPEERIEEGIKRLAKNIKEYV